MSPNNMFQTCVQQNPGANTTILLQCVSISHQEVEEASDASLHSFLLIVAGAMIFFMQTGFAMLCAGSVRLKNVQNTMLKNLLDACGAALAFYVVGYAFAFGGDLDENAGTATTFLGITDFASVGPSPAFWFFQYTFSATSVTIVAGTLAERCQMAAYLCYSIFLAGFIYPVVAHSVWSNRGFLSSTNVDPFFGQGAIDFAGSGVVHLTGGLIALYATLILGPRRGRFFDAQGEPLEHPKPFPGHSIALQLLGTMILWFGWFGFNPGSALLLTDNDNYGHVAANAAVSTALAGAMGGVGALVTKLWWEERTTGEAQFVITMAMNGALAGLVAITSGCALVEPWVAIIIGLVAGWLYMLSSSLLIRFRIDDAVDAIPVHAVGGAWGMMATGLVASPDKLEITYGNADHPGFFYSFRNGGADGSLLLSQFVTILFILGWTFFTMFPFFIWLNYRGWLRADSLEELVGLDISYHGGTLGNDRNGVKKEYVDAYNRHKSSIRRRNPSNVRLDHNKEQSPSWLSSGISVNDGVSDPDQSVDAAQEEAMREIED